ncbi:hypothetical protein [Microbacterium xylanilyticum]
MSRLQALFPDGPRSVEPKIDDHHTLRRLNELFGGQRAGLRRAAAVADVPELVRTVRVAQQTAAPIVLPAQSAKAARRGARRPRRDIVNVVAGVIAAAVLGAAGVASMVHSANANPAAEAYAALQADEAAVEDLAQSVRSSRAQTEGRGKDARDDVQSLQAALEGLQPGLVDRTGDTVKLADATVLADAIADADSTAAAIKAIPLPALPADDPPNVDERSLDSIAKAADRNQARTRAWQQLKAPLADAADTLSSTVAAYDARWAATASGFPALAQRMVDQYSNRDRALRDSVTTAAAQVATTKLTQGAGAAVEAYRAAVQALVSAPRQSEPGGTDTTTTGGETPAPAPATPADTGPSPGTPPTPLPEPTLPTG